MDKLIHIKTLVNLPYSEHISKKYTAIILGSEFCYNQLPDYYTILKIKNSYPDKNLIIATPILYDPAMDKFKNLLKELIKNNISVKIIANDIGLIYYLQKFSLEIIIGRILSNDLSNTSKLWLIKFINSFNIKGIITDKLQSLKKLLNFRIPNLNIIWHEYYELLAITTFCPFEKHFNIKCNKTCDKKGIEPLKNRYIPYKIFLHEKAYFKKGKPLKNLKQRKIESIIHFYPQLV